MIKIVKLKEWECLFMGLPYLSTVVGYNFLVHMNVN